MSRGRVRKHSGEEGRRVLVCGGRNYADRDMVFTTLDDLHATEPIGAIVHGHASGADALADAWAAERAVKVYRFPSAWDLHGRAAGPMRNQRMIEMRPALVVVFAGGRGTADMVRRAEDAAIPVLRISPDSAVPSGSSRGET